MNNSETELSVWDYLNDVYFKKQGKLDLNKIHEVSHRKHLVEKNVKKNKERIYIPNATIQYYNYRYEQDTESIKNEDESDALKTNKNNKKARKRYHQENKYEKDFIIEDIDDINEKYNINKSIQRGIGEKRGTYSYNIEI